MSELTQFDRVKSMIGYFPPKGTAGFARTDDRIESRAPSPRARMTAIVRFTGPPLRRLPPGSMLARTTGTAAGRISRAQPPRRRPVTAGERLEEQPGVDEVAVAAAGPVGGGARGGAGVALAYAGAAGVDPLAL